MQTGEALEQLASSTSMSWALKMARALGAQRGQAGKSKEREAAETLQKWQERFGKPALAAVSRDFPPVSSTNLTCIPAVGMKAFEYQPDTVTKGTTATAWTFQHRDQRCKKQGL